MLICLIMNNGARDYHSFFSNISAPPFISTCAYKRVSLFQGIKRERKTRNNQECVKDRENWRFDRKIRDFIVHFYLCFKYSYASNFLIKGM